MVELDKDYGDKGLHIVTSYVQFQTLEKIEKTVADLKITYPVALDGFFESRFDAPILCCVWVIGVDGKVVHANQQGWEEAAMTELKKVKYPRLGLRRVFSPLSDAAEAFGEGRYLEAWKLASGVADGDESDKVIEQAEAMVERIESMRDTLRKRADVHEICGRYELAVACWAELAAHYRGLEELPDPAKEIARIKALDNYAAELRARHEYLAARLDAWRPFETAGDDPDKVLAAAKGAAEILKKFADDHKEAEVSASARELQSSYERWAKQLEDERKAAPKDGQD
ncbi:MAG: hypothetical protein KDB90_13325 [Planctomycetes bacterium]|nr:hypothetical protein [Planctomycetota bacterium]